MDVCSYHGELGLRRSTGVKYQIKKRKGPSQNSIKTSKPESQPQGNNFKSSSGTFLLISDKYKGIFKAEKDIMSI